MNNIIWQTRKGSLILEILSAYKNFSESYFIKRRQVNGERGSLFLAFSSSIILFLSNVPSELVKLSTGAVDVHYGTYLGILLFITIFFVPLFLYFLAATLHIVLLLFGGQGSFYESRFAMLWAFNVSAPMLFLNGLFKGLLNNSDYIHFLNIILGLIVVWIISSIIAASEKFESHYPLFIFMASMILCWELSIFFDGSYGVV